MSQGLWVVLVGLGNPHLWVAPVTWDPCLGPVFALSSPSQPFGLLLTRGILPSDLPRGHSGGHMGQQLGLRPCDDLGLVK